MAAHLKCHAHDVRYQAPFTHGHSQLVARLESLGMMLLRWPTKNCIALQLKNWLEKRVRKKSNNGDDISDELICK